MSTTHPTSTIAVQVSLTHAGRARLRACAALLDVSTSELIRTLITEQASKLGVPDPETFDEIEALCVEPIHQAVR